MQKTFCDCCGREMPERDESGKELTVPLTKGKAFRRAGGGGGAHQIGFSIALHGCDLDDVCNYCIVDIVSANLDDRPKEGKQG